MSIVSRVYQHQLAEINASTNIDNYAIDPYDLAAGSDPICGTRTPALIDIVSSPNSGELATGFSDLFYHHIWIIEKHTDLGNIVANQTRQIELWNSHFESKTFTGYVVDGDITVDGLASGTLNAIQSTLYDVLIGVNGSPTLDASIVWTFTDAEAPTFTGTIVGRRVLPFTLRHNWATPVLEQIAFRTDVLTGLSGKEQRAGLRDEPRRRCEFEYLTQDAMARSYIEAVLFGWQARRYAVPFWPDKTPLRTAAVSGDVILDIDTVTRDFDIGSLVFVSDGENHDTLEIIDVTADSITTKTGLLNSYSIGAAVTPARLGTLESAVNFDRHTSHHESLRLAWNIATDEISTNRLVDYTPETYRGVEVYNKSNDYSQPISIQQNIVEQIFDNEVGVYSKTPTEPFPRRTYPFADLLERSEFGQFYQWIYNRRGKLNPFWFVERVPTFFLQADVLSGDTTMVVTSGGYSNLLFAAESRRDIAIRTSTGWKYRRITGAYVNVDGVTETITLDTSLGVALTAADNPLMSLLKFVRLSTDQIELSYETTGAARTAASFVDLITTN